jgi:quercetin dioxygenase-like cupin family protein
LTGPRVIRSAQRPVLTRPGGQPALQRLVDSEAGARALTVLSNDCGAGEAVRAHTHDVEEVLLVVSGSCEVGIDGTTATVSEGDAVVIPAGQPHSFRARQDGTRVLGILAGPDARTHYPG